MLSLTLVLTMTMTAPPTEEQVQLRRQRIEEIQRLSQEDADASVQQVVRLVDGKGPVWERVTVLKSLRDRHKERALPIVRRLAASGKDPVAIEAAILAYRWSPDAGTLKNLRRLRDTGASLRRAFWIADDHGRPVYRKEAALPFLLACLQSPTLHTRLDGALGLVELNDPGYREQGMAVLRAAVSHTDPAVRLVGLRYVIVPFPDRSLDALLEAAREDPDPKVRALAFQINKR